MPTLPTRLLQPHPAAPGTTVARLSVDVDCCADGALHLRYTLQARLDAMRIPPPRPPAAVDGLWAHSCCEAFVGVDGPRAYREFNFSPSGEWPLYAFADYRQQVAAPAELPAPAIAVQRDAHALVLDVRLDAAALPRGGPLQLGLSAVVESIDGALSYWALLHPGPRPDFHHHDAFTLTLPTPRR